MMMPFRMHLMVSSDALEKLHCALCQNYLSHFPIYSCPDIGDICGRCPVLEDDNPTRNTAYEALANSLLFPCKNAPYGCPESLSPDALKEHEESCFYQQYFCPILPSASCAWQGHNDELVQHFEESHGIYLLNGNGMFELDFTTSYRENYLLPVWKEIFVVHKVCDMETGNIWCQVSFVGPKQEAKEFSYDIKLETKGTNHKIETFPLKEIESFQNPHLNQAVAVKINSTYISEVFDNPSSVVCTVTIKRTPKETTESISPVRIVENMNALNEEILSEIECPVCMECMIPPIFQCVFGHSICGDCRAKVRECPSCKGAINETRNVLMEKITERVNYHCKYREFGCFHAANSRFIKAHEAECKHGPYLCALRESSGCAWKGRITEVLTHAINSHPEHVLDYDTITSPFFEEDMEDEDCFVFEKHGEIFRILYKKDAENCYWSVQLVGPKEDSEKFLYILDMVDTSGGQSKYRFFVKRDCARYVKEEEAFADFGLHVRVPLEMIRCMIGADLSYRVQIVKK